MSKAILIMDMPSGCVDCNLCVEASESSYVCRAVVENEMFYKDIDFDIVNNYNDKAIWCPLREVPQKKKILSEKSFDGRIRVMGYNACIDEIGGGE